MKLTNIIEKARIGANIGSLAASVFLDGHNQQKNDEIIGKLNLIFAGIHELATKRKD